MQDKCKKLSEEINKCKNSLECVRLSDDLEKFFDGQINTYHNFSLEVSKTENDHCPMDFEHRNYQNYPDRFKNLKAEVNDLKCLKLNNYTYYFVRCAFIPFFCTYPDTLSSLIPYRKQAILSTQSGINDDEFLKPLIGIRNQINRFAKESKQVNLPANKWCSNVSPSADVCVLVINNMDSLICLANSKINKVVDQSYR